MKRLQREYADLSKRYSINLERENIFEWLIKIPGPDSTPYYGGMFIVKISFPTEYPLRSPSVEFQTKIFHPNISPDGKICLGVIGTGWKITYNIMDVISDIVGVLSTPDFDNPVYPEIAMLRDRDESVFYNTAKEWTLEYAM